jgi:hypothetical protein
MFSSPSIVPDTEGHDTYPVLDDSEDNSAVLGARRTKIAPTARSLSRT